MDREIFLGRLRRRLAGVVPPDLPAGFPPTPASGAVTTADRFAAVLAASGGLARRVDGDRLSVAVRDVISETPPERRVAVAPDVGPFRTDVLRGLEQAHAEVMPEEPGGWQEAAAAADWGVTSGLLGIASTGSVLLAPGRDSPRSVSLLPSAHLIILSLDRLVAGLEEALPVLSRTPEGSSSAVLITGPSRTSDIEMVTVYGVHGPRILRVLLVEPS